MELFGYFDAGAQSWFSRARYLSPSSDLFLTYVSNGNLRDQYQRAAAFEATRPAQGAFRSSQEVYHYTGLSTFKSIVTGSQLWASHHSIMNDFQEIEFAWIVLSIQISNRLNNKEFINHDYFDTARSILMRDVEFYILSFSLQPSLLSQWRAYARPHGVSIGFPADLFEGLARENEDISFAPVIYSSESHMAMLGPIAEDLAEIFDRWQVISDPNIAEEIAQCRIKFLEVAPFIKHGSFYEEKEVRLVTTGAGFDKYDRPDGRGRYVKIDLNLLFARSLKEDLIYSKIFISPTREPDGDIKTLSKFMKDSGARFGVISETQIPLIYFD